MAKTLTDKHNEKRAEALRANLMRRKEQARGQGGDKAEKPLPMETPPVKDTRP